MQFIVTGYDGTDEDALNRRMSAREAHLAGIETMRNSGQLLYAAAMLDSSEKMIGSMLIVEFPSRKELDDWLKTEAYVVGDVWRKVDTTPCKVAAAFAK
jgi:uncharacterized protein YciI